MNSLFSRACRPHWALIGSVATSISLQGCAADAPTVPTRTGEPVSLLIQGYNYTDDYIESFTVNGQGGGNIFESGPSSGGGKSACCLSYTPGTSLPIRLKVRWTASYCWYRGTTKYGPTAPRLKDLWKEAEALVTHVNDEKPRALEVHFFPDGRVEAAITAGYSPPRLVLQRNSDGRRPGVQHDYPWCTDEQLR